jgi:ABC-2 type transport system ATP-binding protein
MRLEINDVSKTYRGGKQAIAGVNMSIGTGVLGLLGPNGAGKSSLMRIIATITRPTGGQVTWNGTDIAARPDALRRDVGYLPQDFGVYPHLSAREFLSYLAAVKGMPAKAARNRIGELLEVFNLAGAGRRPLGRYSGGMLRRVGIAQALLADPRMLIVDEPTAGLDPEERMVFRNLLSDLAADRVVLLSTHIVSDVESVAADIAIMAHGRLVSRGSPQELLERARGQVWELTVAPAALAGLRERHVVSRMVRTEAGVRIRVLAAEPPGPGAVPAHPDLEDAYLATVHSRPMAVR